MGVLQRFERRVEQIVNVAFARAFKSEVQPVEIASALQRECDDRAAIVSRGRTMVPNVFVIELGETDYARLTVYAEPLGAELADMVREHAAEQRYSFVGPVRVDFERQDDLDTGMFRVRSTAIAGVSSKDGRASNGAPYLEVNGTRHLLAGPITVIGRGTDVDLRIDDPGISRRHAEVRLHPSLRDAALLVDLGSTNGVLIGGRQVPQAELRDGSAVQLGSTTVIFRDGSRPG